MNVPSDPDPDTGVSPPTFTAPFDNQLGLQFTELSPTVHARS
ncbi:hypothetical protein BZL29_3802 [Mycobacterium kansasii]|uniref:Uncharacterized protein n=1 Tax=Mycobacterium kansasii TaxID=1768 RepID=A0A1V3XE78_MYCKA|nr:hypothetical protein BZL29_3802 [Mycobacterium kansasii]